MNHTSFDFFFNGPPRRYLFNVITQALVEDGQDLTSFAVFSPTDTLKAEVIAKDTGVIAGLPLLSIVLQEALPESDSPGCSVELHASDGDRVTPGTVLASLSGGARRLLKGERVLLNYLSHLSGIATATAAYVKALEGTQTILLDTRKTLPGLRYPEKYAVLMGGARNHRRNLEEMLMLKDNHIDRAGSISLAVAKLREAYSPCPPIEVECRNLEEVHEAVACNVDWIMLDNMNPDQVRAALPLIPSSISTEVSGGISIENIADMALRGEKGPNYISVGRLTHSSPSLDCSMRIIKDSQ